MKTRYFSKTVNQKTIADELNVSVMTVSRALRNHPDLSQATKDRIMAKAIDLGYTKIPSQLDKFSPRGKRVGLFLCQEPNQFSWLDSGVMKLLFTSIEKECQKHHIEVVIQFLKPSNSPVAIKNKTIDAAFLLGRYTAETVAFLKNIPTIAVSSFTVGLDIPRITADNQEGTRLATQHLIELGHREIIFVGEEGEPLTDLFRVRSEGYTLAMSQNGLDPVIVFSKVGGNLEEIMPRLLKSTAVVCGSDTLAGEIKQLVTQCGLDVPGDISITGFDNVEESKNRQITSYAPDWEQLGRMAVDLLIFQQRELLSHPFKLIIPGKLLIRSSTGPVRQQSDKNKRNVNKQSPANG